MPNGRKPAMRSSFHDKSETDYDNTIAETALRMEDCTPCQRVTEIDWLVARLAQIRPTYRARPCMENYCWSGLFGFMVPHRSRIDRRIEAFKGERIAHERECQDTLAEQARNDAKAKDDADRQHQLNIEDKKISSRERIAAAEVEARCRSTEVVETKTQRHGLHR